MMPNLHLMEVIARERLQEARARAAHRKLLGSLAPRLAPLRLVVGLSLIRAGRWLAGPRHSAHSGRSRLAA